MSRFLEGPGGIVFQKIRQIVGGHDIADRHDFYVFPDETMFGDSAKDQAPNPSEPINCNFYCHSSISIQVKFKSRPRAYYWRRTPGQDEL